MRAYSPTGKLIQGTSDDVLCVAYVSPDSYRRKADGSLDWDWEGETKVYWDTQETKRDPNGELLWTDEDGIDWPTSQLILRDEGDDQE